MTIKRLHVGPRLSQVAIHGNTVYSAGIVAGDATADAAGQTRQILELIDGYLAEAGTDKTKITERDDLARRHQRLRGDEFAVGRMGAERQYTAACVRGSQTCRPAVQGRNSRDRGNRLKATTP